MQLKLTTLHKTALMQLLHKPKCNIFASMGAGKTILMLTLMQIRKQLGDAVFPVIIFAPKRVAISTWSDWKLIDHSF